jgi:hypothetical protein
MFSNKTLLELFHDQVSYEVNVFEGFLSYQIPSAVTLLLNIL